MFNFRKFCENLVISVFLALVIMGILVESAQGEQRGIAENVLRFHVLANSDSADDQALKLAVRDEVIGYVQSLGGNSLAETRVNVTQNLQNIAEIAAIKIKDEGYDYDASAKLENFNFPPKTYGDITFPAGSYEALRIEIGEAKGQNWWCVIYPNICLTTTTAMLPPDSQEALEGAITAEEYGLITGAQPIRSRLLDLFNR